MDGVYRIPVRVERLAGSRSTARSRHTVVIRRDCGDGAFVPPPPAVGPARPLPRWCLPAALLTCTPAMAATQQTVPISSEPPLCEVVLEEALSLGAFVQTH